MRGLPQGDGERQTHSLLEIEDDWLPAGGVGVRFRLTSLPLNMRADFAWGRDDSTFSLAVGEAF
jgi:hypothetical protein